jgi:hypothetical protein
VGRAGNKVKPLMSAGIPVNESKRGCPKLEAGGKSESSILRWNESQHRQRSRRGVALAVDRWRGLKNTKSP